MSAAGGHGLENGICIAIGPGELLDRLTIMRIKNDRVRDHASNEAIAGQLSMLEKRRRELPRLAGLEMWERELAALNLQLWHAEDLVRQLAVDANAREGFCSTATKIQELNDQRAHLKVEIDEAFGWSTSEKKQYLPVFDFNASDQEDNKALLGIDSGVLKDCRFGRMLINSNDIYIGRSLSTYGEFSPAEGKLFGTLINTGDVVVEAGANVGCFTLLFANLVGGDGRVYAFEPQRLLFQILCANLALNGLSNVEAWPAGVGARIGQMFVPHFDYGTPGNFSGAALAPEGPGECVPITTIDHLDLEVCGLIKADVQGMEGDVLEGASETIRRCRPLLYVENDRRENSPALLGRIDALDYQAFWHLPPLFDPDNYFCEVENIFPGIVSANMLCVPGNVAVTVPGLTKVTGPDDWWMKL